KTTFVISECPTQPPTNPPTSSSSPAGSSSTEPMPSSSFQLLPSTLSLISSIAIFFILVMINKIFIVQACTEPRMEYLRECTQDKLGIQSTLLFYNQQQYDYSITPTATATAAIEGFYFALLPDVNYTLEWKSSTNSSCNGTSFFLTPNPHFIISQPKCRYSLGSATFVKPDGLDYNMASCDSTPCNISFGNQLSTPFYYEDREVECVYNPAVYELTDSYPNLKVQDTYIYNNTGSIQLLDTSKYTNWTLTYDEDDTPIPESAPSSATWENLKSREYTLILKSSDCGIQRIPVEVSSTWPNFYINYGKNAECPRNTSVQINFDDPNILAQGNGVAVSIDGKPIVQNEQSVYLNSFNVSEFEVHFSYDGSSYLKVASTPIIIGDIQYTIDPCTRLVTLYYNETLYPDVSAKTDNGDLVITDKTFTVPSDRNAIIESRCFFSPVSIRVLPLVQPSFKIVRPQKFCGDTKDVLIVNYYDFEEITMGDMGDIQHDGHGLFKNVFSKDSYINYKINGCFNHNSFFVDSEIYSLDQVEETIEIVSYPSCNGFGNVSYTIRDIENNIVSHTSYTYYQLSQPTVISTLFPNCQQVFSKMWYPPFIEKYVHNFPGIITVEKNSTCMYSNDAEILIAGNHSPIDNIVVKGVSFYPLSLSEKGLLFKGLPYGDYDIKIKSIICSDYYVSISIGTNNHWEFPAVVTPVTGDCTVANGAITYDTSIFSDITDPQSYTNLQSGFQQIIFELSNSTCSGVAIVYVPTYTGSFASDIVLGQPSCVGNNDGYVQLLVNSQSLVQSTPTAVELNGIVSSNNFYNLYEGEYNFIVYNNTCSWPHKVSLKVNEPGFTFNKIGDTLDECKQKTFISITPSSSSVFVNAITSNDVLDQYSNNTYAYYPENFAKTRQLFIQYNSVCMKVLRIGETNDLSANIAWPTFRVPNIDCTDPSVQNSAVQITNPSNMKLYPYGQSTFSIKSLYSPKYRNVDMAATAQDYKSKCLKNLYLQNVNQGTVAKTLTKASCPGSIDGKIQIDVDPKLNVYQVLNYYDFIPVESGSKLNTYNNITNSEYNLVRSFRNNPFCLVTETLNIVVDEPTVTLSSVGVCDASNTAIGDAGVVTNNLSIKTTNVTYNLNGHVSTNPVFKGLSAGNYNSTVTIYNSVCRRVIQSNSVSVAKLPSVSVNVDVSTCMKAVINPSNPNIQFKYTIRDSTDKVVLESTSIGSFTFTPTSQDTYSVISSDM
ncbi:hypothetical protein CYY_010253, partial [Polysphondylium violaceum]